jgi:hypothetical protein
MFESSVLSCDRSRAFVHTGKFKCTLVVCIYDGLCNSQACDRVGMKMFAFSVCVEFLVKLRNSLQEYL